MSDPRPLSESLDHYRERLAYLQRIQPEWAKRERLYKCRECLDEGFILVDEKANTVRPCRLCRPEQFAHWTKGGYRPLYDGGSVLCEKKGRGPTNDERNRERYA